RLVGEGKALEMNLTGDPISAREAPRVGLVDAVVPDPELFDTALAWARQLAGPAPRAIGHIKRVANRGELDEGLRAEAEAVGDAGGAGDAREGISAFLQKRQATFRGK